ncbi:glycosyltransferase family 2 protein [Phycicoccus sp. SLBN-51]|uniref:glycosyltransferase family 2 protein n=1 Tax=Phycicoccus sp. SLBN-51 TaxID=2768447 RepID=UPI00116E8580|nr:glycosyltransferase family 2 protein [Phycicoccus sp. SLBN-51]TQJ51731.1 glycosyltransferase involved in cell wall biosynthesis [Phycicoccus sp. SLBN-51]
MDTNDDVWVVVPVFNEAPVVREVLEGLRTRFPNVVAVDDGSTDASAAEIEASGAHLVRHPFNMGAGAALQTGVNFALLDPRAAYFVTFDADGQHRVEDAVAMVERLRSTPVDVLIGSRFLGSATNMRRSRRGLLLVGRLFERLSSGIALTDAHNGLRAFSRSFAEVLKLSVADMGWASEFLTRLAESGLRYAEHPVTVQYTPYSLSKGQPSINSVNIGMDVVVNRVLRGRR